MPIYDWKCKNDCQTTCETVLRVMQVVDPEYHPTCDKCGEKMARDFQKEHNGSGVLAEWSRNKGIFPYVDHNLGSEPVQVESQQHRRQLMRERNLHDREPTSASREKARDARRKTFSFGR